MSPVKNGNMFLYYGLCTLEYLRHWHLTPFVAMKSCCIINFCVLFVPTHDVHGTFSKKKFSKCPHTLKYDLGGYIANIYLLNCQQNIRWIKWEFQWDVIFCVWYVFGTTWCLCMWEQLNMNGVHWPYIR